jgi:hypothetical protein
MSDEDFIAALEACRLPESLFDHAAHVRAGYLYLRRQEFPFAASRMCATIKDYARSLGKGERYHETITIGFMALIKERLFRGGDGGGWEGFKAQNPELLRKDVLLEYYPKAVLDSEQARSGFLLMKCGAKAPKRPPVRSS